MTTTIHPSAVIHPQAQLGADVQIGAHTIIEAGVTIGDRTRVGPLAHIQGLTEIGPDNEICTSATIGFPPQVVGFKLGPTRTVIGARNVFREYVTVHASMKEDGATVIGDDGYFMVSSHIAHDCQLGNQVIMANGALLGGHVSVGDRAFISGNTVVHQFCRIGRLAMVGGLTRVVQDVPPFTIIEGVPGRIRGINVVGLRRAGFTSQERMDVKRLLREIHRQDMLVTESLAQIDTATLTVAGRELVEFYRSVGKRGILAFPVSRRGGPSEAEVE